MQIAVYGSGYLGNIISACVADFGLPVTCFDENTTRLREVAQGRIPSSKRTSMRWSGATFARGA